MCGIIAVVGKTQTNKIDIDAMLASLSHRGPDDHGTLSFPLCTLGQTRLSIIDLAGGHQPMRDNSRDLAISFNGEIYNYLELKKKLKAKGYVFSTNSDTEVILKAYQEYGENCPEHLDGMFAFVIWDNTKKQLFMARDRFGKKPIYYAFDENKNLLIASEIKALFASGKIKGVVDYRAIDNYLTLMYIPPWKTVYKNIHTIPPASSAIFKDGNLQIKRYWQLEKRSTPVTYAEAKEEVRRLLTSAVKKRMVADVEIGSFLSGGVDSTLVTALAQSFSKTPIKTFSVGYQDYINELPFAEEAVKKIGTDHHTLQAKDDMIEELKTAIEYFDEPHADSSDFPQHLVSKLARTKVKVALSGDGADELFLGYGWHTKHLNLSYRKHFIEKVFLDPFQGFIRNISIFTSAERKMLWKNKVEVNEDFLSDQLVHSKLTPTEKINLFDFTTYLPGQLLVKSDRMGMMNSLETRSPFLDHNLAEYVYGLPDEYKLTPKQGSKIILKDILGEYMPQEFVHRKKQGFGAPVKKWIEQESFKKDIYEKLCTPGAELHKIMNESFIKKLVGMFYSNKNDSYYYKIWVLYCLELWFQSHKQHHA